MIHTNQTRSTPSQISQVVTNQLVNAAHAIEPDHGNVNVKTEVGRGTTIRVTLPVNQPAIQATDWTNPT